MLAETMYYTPTENRANYWYAVQLNLSYMNIAGSSTVTLNRTQNPLVWFSRYSTDYDMFRFCVADSEHDWREGTEQYKFIENCLATVDRKKQPWLIFIAHRVLGYSSGFFYGRDGSFAEPMSRQSLQKLWQKYRVDLAFYGHVHNYERTCPVYEVPLLLLLSSTTSLLLHPVPNCKYNLERVLIITETELLLCRNNA